MAVTDEASADKRARETRAQARDHYIWPLLSKAAVEQGTPQILTEGSGVRVRSVEGVEYLDLMSTVSRASTLGYDQEPIAAAVYEQLRRLHYGGTAFSQADVTIELAAELARRAPAELTATVFVGSGSEANEVAFKLARLYHASRESKPRAYKVIARWDDYHGAVGGATAASDWLGVRRPVEPGLPGFSRIPAPTCYRCPFDLEYPSCGIQCAEYLAEHIEHEGPELVSAFIVEPIAQANGVQVPPDGYLRRVKEICERYEVLFIADEVITAFGRVGEWFGVDRWEVEPDIMTMAKALTAGFLPLGATIASKEIRDALDVFPDIHTYGGHPASAVAALTAISIYESENLIERAAAEESHLLRLLGELERHPVVGQVRGKGMWAAVDFTRDRTTRATLPGETLDAIVRRTRELGVLVGRNGTAIEIAPPLIIGRDDLAAGIARLDQAIDDICA